MNSWLHKLQALSFSHCVLYVSVSQVGHAYIGCNLKPAPEDLTTRSVGTVEGRNGRGHCYTRMTSNNFMA